MTADQLVDLGFQALDARCGIVLEMRDGATFGGMLLAVEDDYVIVGGLGFPLADIRHARLRQGQ